MSYHELEQLKQSKEYKAANDLFDAINNFSFNEKNFAISTTNQHRTLQQKFFRMIVDTIRLYGSEDYHYDGRNEAAHKLAKKILESGVLDEAYLPCI